MLADKRIGFIGGGNMAEAIIKGLLAGGVPRENICVAEPVPQRRDYLADRYGIAATADNVQAALFGQVTILAVKPQVSMSALQALTTEAAAGKLFISIMAGVSTESIEAVLDQKVRVIRVMPNTPALVLAAASAVAAGAHATADDLALALELFSLLGIACSVEEKLMDAVTGLSGSGPAYVFTVIEALADGGVKNGLARDIATKLAAQTVFGAAKMVLETGEHPAQLRDRVTSPSGTTIAGMHTLENEGLRGTLISAVDTATARSRELGKG